MKFKLIKQVALSSLCSLSLLYICARHFASRPSGATTGPAGGAPNGTSAREFRPELRLSNRVIDGVSESGDRLMASSSQLLQNLSFPIQPTRRLECAPGGSKAGPIQAASRQLLIVVNSKWSNFERRRRIRSGWLSAEQLEDGLCKFSEQRGERAPLWRVDVAFAIGNSPGAQTELDARVLEESSRHKDILLIKLDEHYRSMSLKHLSIFKWILGSARFGPDTLVLKCDDDAHVNLELLMELSAAWLAAQGQWERTGQNWIMCARFPANTRVLRRRDQKWALARSEFHFDTFPAYCSGLAYLAPRRLLGRLWRLAQALLWDSGARSYRRPLWVDDVFVTGVLPASLADGLRVGRLNAHFCYSSAQYSRRAQLGLPCAVAELPPATLPLVAPPPPSHRKR